VTKIVRNAAPNTEQQPLQLASIFLAILSAHSEGRAHMPPVPPERTSAVDKGGSSPLGDHLSVRSGVGSHRDPRWRLPDRSGCREVGSSVYAQFYEKFSAMSAVVCARQNDSLSR
jgi:hypothetical protein